MAFQVHWTALSEASFEDEIAYIFKKWNIKEVNKFTSLTDDAINLIRNNPQIGTFSQARNTYSLVISTQTTLFYKVIPDQEVIDLILFWNNKRNPEDLSKLLYTRN